MRVGVLVRVDPNLMSGDLCLLSSPAREPAMTACWLPRGGLALVVALVAGAALLLGPEGLGWTRAVLFLKEA